MFIYLKNIIKSHKSKCGLPRSNCAVLMVGSSKRQILTAAARTLAGQYRAKIKANMDSLMEKAVHL